MTMRTNPSLSPYLLASSAATSISTPPPVRISLSPSPCSDSASGIEKDEVSRLIKEYEKNIQAFESINALRNITAALQIQPANWHYLLRRAELYTFLGHTEGTLNDLMRASTLNPQLEKDFTFLQMRIKAANAVKNPEQALKDFNNALSINPALIKDPAFLRNVGIQYCRVKQWNKGYIHFLKFLRIEPRAAGEVLKQLAFFSAQNKDLSLNPLFLHTRGRAYSLRQPKSVYNTEQALKDLNIALSVYPAFNKNLMFVSEIATLCCQLKQWDLGITHFSSMLKVNSETAEYVLKKLIYFSERNRELEQNPFFLCTRAQAYSILKKTKETLKDYANAQIIYPALAKNSLFLRRQGDAYSEQNEAMKALLKYADALDCKPHLKGDDTFRKNWSIAYTLYIQQQNIKENTKKEALERQAVGGIRSVSPYSGPID